MRQVRRGNEGGAARLAASKAGPEPIILLGHLAPVTLNPDGRILFRHRVFTRQTAAGLPVILEWRGVCWVFLAQDAKRAVRHREGLDGLLPWLRDRLQPLARRPARRDVR
jgi:hypothetical protein